MSTLLIKQNINKAIKEIDDKIFLEAVYTIVSNKIEQSAFELSDELKTELDSRKENHKNGKSVSYTWQSVKKEINAGKG